MTTAISIDGTRLGGSGIGVGLFGVTATTAQPAATAQSTVASTAITNIGSTSLTATDLTGLNALIARVEAIRVLEDAMRTALVNTGVMKGSA